MATKDNLTLLTTADKEKLLKKSAKFLPTNPSDKGFSAAQVKAALYEPAVMNFEYLKRLTEQLSTCFDTIDASHDSTKLDKITNSLSSGDVAAYVVSNNNGSYSQAYMKVVGIAATAWTIPLRRENGEIVVGSPTDNAHAVNLSYANSHYAPKITSGEKVYGTDELGAQKAYDVDSDLVGNGAVVRRETATGTVVVGTPTSNTHATTKSYVDTNFTKKSDIVDAVNDTSTNKPLSANQGKYLKGLIDGIQLLLSSNDSDLDTVQEIVTYIKSNKSLIDSITSSKVNITDIVDNLNSEVTNKPLSAKQGYVLKEMFDSYYNKSDAEDMVDLKIGGISQVNVVTDQDEEKVYDWRIVVRGERVYLAVTDITETE